MIDFDLDFNFIKDQLTDICTIYEFEDNDKKDIINYLIAESTKK